MSFPSKLFSTKAKKRTLIILYKATSIKISFSVTNMNNDDNREVSPIMRESKQNQWEGVKLLNTEPSLLSTKKRTASSAAPLAIIPSLPYLHYKYKNNKLGINSKKQWTTKLSRWEQCKASKLMTEHAVNTRRLNEISVESS